MRHGALRLFSELLPDQERVLGRDHTPRSAPATTSPNGPEIRRCARGVAAALPNCCRTRSGCWAATTSTRSLPAATSPNGPERWAMRGGVAAVSGLLPDQERVLGRDHLGHTHHPQHLRALDRRGGRCAWRHCGCTPNCCRTRSGCWASPPQHAQYPQPHRAVDESGGDCGTGRCGFLLNCCWTRSECSDATTAKLSLPSVVSVCGALNPGTRRGDADGCVRRCRLRRPGSAPMIE